MVPFGAEIGGKTGRPNKPTSASLRGLGVQGPWKPVWHLNAFNRRCSAAGFVYRPKTGTGRLWTGSLNRGGWCVLRVERNSVWLRGKNDGRMDGQLTSPLTRGSPSRASGPPSYPRASVPRPYHRRSSSGSGHRCRSGRNGSSRPCR